MGKYHILSQYLNTVRVFTSLHYSNNKYRLYHINISLDMVSDSATYLSETSPIIVAFGSFSPIASLKTAFTNHLPVH